ncbi:uncharacterized protein EAE98_008200 [Botrytis deweyae]|uniref:Suppressor of anucleate metulae protein B n=1 Tax=Botrytis deweyae TaxID=2478750 RepID=A0ABQ7IEP8_9HELO|nr:uncharacterized protein EAE98_008200 [Botrytis deweyae]KAF7921989.1 hypothetical protein EAE98_008200 [Botrytis deweyae]
MPENPRYALQDVQGKGKGLVATQDIPKGTRIIEEKPIMTRPKQAPPGFSLRGQFNALNNEQQQAFLSLKNVHPYKNADEQYFGIFKTNGLPMASDDEGGLFIEACRINHACDNNAFSNWNTNIRKHTIHALRDIHEGEEITISYLGSRSWPREIRRQVLQEKFKFLCSCNLCALPARESMQNDREFMNIARIMTLIPGTFMRNPLQGVRYMDQAVQLLSGKEMGVSLLGGLFVEASKMNIGHGDLARARILAEKATPYLRISYGSDSLQVLDNKQRANHPSMNIYYGLSSLDWATPVHDVPSSLDSNGFEDWLWRREGLQNSQIYFESPNSFLSNSIFPSLLELPHRQRTSPEFYENAGKFNYRPRRHWCFLGEILEFDISVLAILVKDVDEREVQLFLETNARGIFPRLRKAHTVAILYAQRDDKFTETYISLENVALLQIFPISLSHLIALRDLTQEFSTKREVDNARKCHGCGKKSSSMVKCSGCSFFWYCNQKCQKNGWNTKGHKNDCKILKKPDLRGMFLMKWDEFNGVVQFPLSTAVGN